LAPTVNSLDHLLRLDGIAPFPIDKEPGVERDLALVGLVVEFNGASGRHCVGVGVGVGVNVGVGARDTKRQLHHPSYKVADRQIRLPHVMLQSHHHIGNRIRSDLPLNLFSVVHRKSGKTVSCGYMLSVFTNFPGDSSTKLKD
jgi:hypothetical protein